MTISTLFADFVTLLSLQRILWRNWFIYMNDWRGFCLGRVLFLLSALSFFLRYFCFNTKRSVYWGKMDLNKKSLCWHEQLLASKKKCDSLSVYTCCELDGAGFGIVFSYVWGADWTYWTRSKKNNNNQNDRKEDGGRKWSCCWKEGLFHPPIIRCDCFAKKRIFFSCTANNEEGREKEKRVWTKTKGE